MTTIGESKADLEQSLADVLRDLLPQTAGYTLEVDILEKDRKKRSDASRESWKPAVGEIRVRFEGTTEGRPQGRSLPSREKGGQGPHVPHGAATLAVQRVELIKSLRTAEQRPGFHFVSLKWFRDLFLPAQEHGWTTSPTLRDELIRGAINSGIALTSKVPNPKNPSFPVTAIQLDRRHPEVVAIVGDRGTTDSGFEPVEVKGEPLSVTVLSARR